FIPGDDTLQVKGDVTITAEYVDAIDTQGRKDQHVTATAKVRSGHTATLEAPTTLMADTTLPLTVTDPDMNYDPAKKESVQVHLLNTTTGDEEWVTLDETDANSGKFSGTIRAAYGVAPTKGNGILEVKGGDSVDITYVDQLADGGRPDQVRA